MKLRFLKYKQLNNYNKVLISFMMIISLLGMTTLAADARYRVKSSDNLNRIVSRHYVNSSLSKSQLMVAILARNPRAFKGGNINVLMRGRRLVLPDEANIQAVSVEEARAILKQHARHLRSGITGDLSLSEFNVSSNDLVFLNEQHADQQAKLKKLEEEREQLRDQLERLKEEKKNSDQQLDALEVKLEETTKLNTGLKEQQSKQELASTKSQGDSSRLENVISEERKKRLLDEQVKERTQTLKDSNSFLQKRLQETRSELAENTRENISLERQVGQLKKQAKQKGSQVLEQSENMAEGADSLQKEETSVATEIGVAEHSNKPLDSSSSSNMFTKIAWLIPVLALFAGLWFLLRYFLGGKRTNASSEVDTYATDAFGSADGTDINEEYINEEYEEASLETSIKLDVARAYIEADDRQSAYEMLQEVIDEGSEQQQQEAKDILDNYKIINEE